MKKIAILCTLSFLMSSGALSAKFLIRTYNKTNFNVKNLKYTISNCIGAEGGNQGDCNTATANTICPDKEKEHDLKPGQHWDYTAPTSCMLISITCTVRYKDKDGKETGKKITRYSFGSGDKILDIKLKDGATDSFELVTHKE